MNASLRVSPWSFAILLCFMACFRCSAAEKDSRIHDLELFLKTSTGFKNVRFLPMASNNTQSVATLTGNFKGLITGEVPNESYLQDIASYLLIRDMFGIVLLQIQVEGETNESFQPDSGMTQVKHYSSVHGTQYVFAVTEKMLRSHGNHEEKDVPAALPISLSKVQSSAHSVLSKIIDEKELPRWRTVQLSLRRYTDSNLWYYLVAFEPPNIMPTNCVVREHLIVPVFCDGTAVVPER